MAKWRTRNQMIFAVLYVTEQWALTVIKLLRFFVKIFAVFLPGFSFSCTTWHGLTQVSSKLCITCSLPLRVANVLLLTSVNGDKTIKPDVHFAVAVLALAMPVDHHNFSATVPRISRNLGAQKPSYFFLNYHIWSSDCH